MKMKVAILYASFGGGHKSSAQSIKAKLEKDYNVEIQLLDYFEYFNKLINRVSIAVYENIVNLPENFYLNMYQSTGSNTKFSDFITDILKLTGIKLIKYFKKFTPDIVISTHPFATQALSYLKKKNKFDFLLANILTDFEIHKLWFDPSENIDLFFVSSDSMKKNLIYNGVEENKICVSGIPIKEAFSKTYDRTEVYNLFNLNKDLKTITFFAGGGQGIAFKDIFKYLEIALKSFTNYNIVIISGNNAKLKNKIQELVSEIDHKNVKIFSFISEIPELMSISSFIISKPGGLTTSESLAMCTPLIAISPIPGQEVANAKHLKENNAGIYLNDVKEAEILFEKLNNDQNEEYIKELKENIKKISHPNSTEVIINKIFEKYEEYRK